MMSHVKSVHEGVKYDCPHCQKVFTRRKRMAEHVQSVHEGVPHGCPQCDKSFQSRSNLMSHVKSVHEGVKYECPHCQKGFTRRDSMTAHVRAFHEGVKHGCPECDRVFSWRSDLAMHLKTHHRSGGEDEPALVRTSESTTEYRQNESVTEAVEQRNLRQEQDEVIEELVREERLKKLRQQQDEVIEELVREERLKKLRQQQDEVIEELIREERQRSQATPKRTVPAVITPSQLPTTSSTPKRRRVDRTSLMPVHSVSEVLKPPTIRPALARALDFNESDDFDESDDDDDELSEERAVHRRGLDCSVCGAVSPVAENDDDDETRPGYVYVMSDLRACYLGGHVGSLTRFKVGSTFNPFERLADLQTGNPDLTLIGHFHVGACTAASLLRVERATQQQLESRRLAHLFASAREFFAFSSPAVAFEMVRAAVRRAVRADGDVSDVCSVWHGQLDALAADQRLLVLALQSPALPPFLLFGAIQGPALDVAVREALPVLEDGKARRLARLLNVKP
jgi:uncharacterized C2H2 Zn-finger protein